MTERQQKWASYALLVVAILVASYFGVSYPVPEPPEVLGTTNLSALSLSETLAVTGASTLTGNTTVGGTFGVTGASTLSGDITFGGTTPLLTIGDAGAEDAGIVYDGNAKDFYAALDDSADDLVIGLGSTIGTTGIVYLDENQDVGLGGASAGAKLDVTGNQLIDGAADEIQLQVQGYTTQTNSLLVLEQSDGTDELVVTNAGVATLTGLANLNGGIAVDTSAFTVADTSGNTDIAGTLNYGANDLYPVGFASSGQQAIYGSSLVTGTLAAPHGLTTVTFCLATLGEDPEAAGGAAAHVSVAVAANVCTLKVWQDDFVTAATETDVVVQWLVIGAP